MKSLKKDLSKRLFSSFFLVGLASLLLIFAYVNFFSFFVVLSVAFFATAATYEFTGICKVKLKHHDIMPLIFSPLIVISFYLSTLSQFFFNFPLILSFLFVVLIFLKNFSSVKNSISNISVAFFGLLYISIPLGMLVYILYSDSPSLIDGRLWVAIILLLSKTSDIFGYFIGKSFGKRKMIERISPNKTWEGSIGGIVATLTIACFVQYFFPHAFSSYVSALAVGLITAALSQLGDLCESLLKRDAKVKDSNKIPGIGGILDSLDSLLFTIPFYYIWLSYLT